MPRRIFGQTREGVYPVNPKDITTPRVFDKVRHWPLRPEFDRTNDHKIFKTFKTEFIDDVSPIDNLCRPRHGYKYQRPAVLRCQKGERPVTKCGIGDMKYVPSRAKTFVTNSKNDPTLLAQVTRKKKDGPAKPTPSQMNKKSMQRLCLHNEKSSLCLDYDTLEDELAILAY